MSDERLEAGKEVSSEATARRKFLKKSGRVAVAAPAVVLLLSASSKNALAIDAYGPPTNPPG